MKRPYPFIGFALLSLCLTAACNDHAPHEDHAANVAHADSTDLHQNEEGTEIVISPADARAAGIKTETAQRGPFSGSIAVGGKIMATQGGEATVVAGMAGTVSLLQSLSEGSSVSRGAALFRISGNHIQGGDPAQQARITYEQARRTYERTARLAEEKIATARERDEALAAYEAARAAYEALAADARNTAGGTTVSAPLGGYVKNCLVKEGDYVTAGQPLATLTQDRRLYLKAYVPERYYAELDGITGAQFKTSYSDETFDVTELNGRLVAVGRTPAAEIPGYLTVTFEFDNRGALVPGAFAEVCLLTRGKSRTDVVSVPRSALLEEQGVFYVYLHEDSSCYRRREVIPGNTNARRVEILTGLQGGEPVVTQGAMSIKLAGAGHAIPAHTHNH